MKTFYSVFYHQLDECALHKKCYEKMILYGKKSYKNENIHLLYNEQGLLNKIYALKDENIQKIFLDIFDKFKEYDLPLLEHNIDSLIIKSKQDFFQFITFSKCVIGLYDVRRNRIYYNGDSRALHHEMLHVSSSLYPYSGFANKKTRFGNAFNEGYTEYLNQSFDYNNNQIEAYTIEMKVVKMLCDLKETNFTKQYFNASIDDVYSLFNIEDRYLLTDLFSCLDLYYYLINESSTNLINAKKILYYLNIINETYLCLLINKYKDGYNNDIGNMLLKHHDDTITEFAGTTLYSEEEYEDLTKHVLKKYKR